MRMVIVMAAFVALASASAHADIVRHASIPESFWGAWAASPNLCGQRGKFSMSIEAKSYVGADGSCAVEWVDETPGAQTPNYSAHVNCSGAGPQSSYNVLLRRDDADHIMAGADFAALKRYQRCSKK